MDGKVSASGADAEREEMAERVIRQVIDDIDGTDITEGGETVEFSIRGVAYRIDLSAQNASKFEKALSPYVKAAERISGDERPRATRSKRGRGNKKSASEDLSAIRAWASENGYSVSPRGRISSEVRTAYEEANAQ
ncbi:histone-like nucleoid-structuring protein Lsr2 [Mycolicibacterium grossiae]|nr:Lsr2 family protein [Mycolicibacterium grossiae]